MNNPRSLRKRQIVKAIHLYHNRVQRATVGLSTIFRLSKEFGIEIRPVIEDCDGTEIQDIELKHLVVL